MKIILTIVLTIAAMTTLMNAGDKFADLTPEYLNNTASVKVKRIIANDPMTDHKTLEILFQDKDLRVRGNVVANPNF